MPRASTNTCLIDYRAESSTIELRALGPLAGKAEHLGRRIIETKGIDEQCRSYWRFVNESIESGVVTGTPRARRAFYDDLKTRGAMLCNALLDPRSAQRLWALAKNSDVLVIITGLLHVPWEALYNASGNGPSGFLADQCVITRWPEDTGDSTRGIVEGWTGFTKERLVCLDGVLDSTLRVGESTISGTLADDGEEVYVTSLKSDLIGEVSSVRVVHWICEHASQGLRLDNEVYYTAEDSVVYRFPPGVVLVLTSCSTGPADGDGRSIAGGICAASDCTVIAPSSKVAVRAGLQFVRSMNAMLKEAAESDTIADIWRRLRKIDELGVQDEAPTAETCFSLWYGLYGNALAALRSEI